MRGITPARRSGWRSFRSIYRWKWRPTWRLQIDARDDITRPVRALLRRPRGGRFVHDQGTDDHGGGPRQLRGADLGYLSAPRGRRVGVEDDVRRADRPRNAGSLLRRRARA